MNYVTLNNGVKMPKLGYGVYQTPPEETERCVLDAIRMGYRSIDTAQAYGNEEGVGNAIVKCGLPREDLFITTKIWISNYGYEKAKASIEESLKKLQTGYIDLLLLHQPFGDYYGAYRAMEEAYKEGKVRAIGVSNFYPDRYLDIFHFSEIKPAINQVETHVFQQQKVAKKIHGKARHPDYVLGSLCRRQKRLLPESRIEGNRRSVRQIGGPGGPAVLAAKRRGGDPQVHPRKPDEGKLRRL